MATKPRAPLPPADGNAYWKRCVTELKTCLTTMQNLYHDPLMADSVDKAKLRQLCADVQALSARFKRRIATQKPRTEKDKPK